MFNLFTGVSFPLYISLPFFIGAVVSNPGSALPLYGFITSTVVIMSMFGGVYAALPAYEA